jgi:hypothetical protein
MGTNSVPKRLCQSLLKKYSSFLKAIHWISTNYVFHESGHGPHDCLSVCQDVVTIQVLIQYPTSIGSLRPPKHWYSEIKRWSSNPSIRPTSSFHSMEPLTSISRWYQLLLSGRKGHGNTMDGEWKEVYWSVYPCVYIRTSTACMR